MKQLLTSLLLFMVCTIFAQDSIRVEPPLILKKLSYQDTISVDAYLLKFSKVISDSRCPKYVTCVRAGEIIIELAIYKDKKLLGEQILKIPPIQAIRKQRKAVYIADKIRLYLYNVLPVPESRKQIQTSDYYLQYTTIN